MQPLGRRNAMHYSRAGRSGSAQAGQVSAVAGPGLAKRVPHSVGVDEVRPHKPDELAAKWHPHSAACDVFMGSLKRIEEDFGTTATARCLTAKEKVAAVSVPCTRARQPSQAGGSGETDEGVATTAGLLHRSPRFYGACRVGREHSSALLIENGCRYRYRLSWGPGSGLSSR
jgi:hypothetical protein